MTTDERRNKVRKRYRKMEREDDGSQMSLSERNQAYKDTVASGGTPRQAVRAYCRGNKWLTENAKAVGNWPDD